MSRILFLIDGFNVYHSLNNIEKFHKYKWLDYSKLVRCFIKSRDQIVGVRFFTAYAYWNPRKVKRHKTLVEALRYQGVTVIVGKFYPKNKTIKINRQLSLTHYYHEEKHTDVNIAINLLEAAIDNIFDIVFIISADSDLIPAIKAVKNRFSTKDIRIVFPMRNYSKDLEEICGPVARIKEHHLRTCQLPDTLVVDSITGRSVSRPLEWK